MFIAAALSTLVGVGTELVNMQAVLDGSAAQLTERVAHLAGRGAFDIEGLGYEPGCEIDQIDGVALRDPADIDGDTLTVATIVSLLRSR